MILGNALRTWEFEERGIERPLRLMTPEKRIAQLIDDMGGSQAYFQAQRERMKFELGDARERTLAQIDRLRAQIREDSVGIL